MQKAKAKIYFFTDTNERKSGDQLRLDTLLVLTVKYVHYYFLKLSKDKKLTR